MTCEKRRPLGDLCDIVTGGTPSRSESTYFGGGIPWVKIGDLLQGVVMTTAETISGAGLESSSAKLLPRGTVLISVFATIGRTALLGIEAATNQAIAGVTPKTEGELDPGYLKHFFDASRQHLERLARGVAQPNINIGILRSLEIPLPPLPEQRRIAAILDKADALRTKRREALSQLDRLAQAIFLDMFGDMLTNSRGWAEGSSLGEVADIVSGVTKGRKLEGKTTRKVPYLAVANVQDMRLSLSTVKHTDATEEEIERYALREGDLLLTEGGDPDKLGRGTLWHGELPECIHQNHVFRVRVASTKVTPYFLNWLIGSQRGKRYFLKSAKQTTGIASINMTQLRGFPLLLPPLSLQREFEFAIGEVRRHASRLVAAVEESNSLFASLQHSSFQGDL